MENLRNLITICEALTENTAKTLYHGTLKKYVSDIANTGLHPTVGEFTSNAYGNDAPPLTFAADKSDLDKCISAILAAMDNNNIDITPQSFKNNAAIVVIKHGESYYDQRKDDDEEYPMSVEPRDYYSDGKIDASYVLTGQKLLSFLRKNGIDLKISLYGQLDDAGERDKLIKKLIKYYNDRPINDVLLAAKSKSTTELRLIAQKLRGR